MKYNNFINEVIELSYVFTDSSYKALMIEAK